MLGGILLKSRNIVITGHTCIIRKMEFISNDVIRLDRELSDLDSFTLDFIRILRKQSKYVIVSGYVSILLGRARASENIDVIIPKIDFPVFSRLLKELDCAGFLPKAVEYAGKISV